MHSLSRGFLDKPLQKILLCIRYFIHLWQIWLRYLVISSIKEKVKSSNGNKTNHSS